MSGLHPWSPRIWRIPNLSKIPFGCNKEEHAGWDPTCPHLNLVLMVHLGTGSFKTKQTKNAIQPFLQINFVKYQCLKKNLLCLFYFFTLPFWMLHIGCFLPSSQSQTPGLHKIAEVKKRHGFGWSWGFGEGK